MNSKNILKKIKTLNLDDFMPNKLEAKKSLLNIKNNNPSNINNRDPGTKA